MKKISLMILLLSFSLTFVACSNDVNTNSTDKETTNVEDTSTVIGDGDSEMDSFFRMQVDFAKALDSLKELSKEQLKLSEDLHAYQIKCGNEYVIYNDKEVVEIIFSKDLGDRMETVNIYYYDAKIDKFYLYDAVTDTVSSLRPER